MTFDPPPDRDFRRGDALGAITYAVLAATVTAALTVGGIMMLRQATSCAPAPRPPHFAPPAIERMAEVRP